MKSRTDDQKVLRLTAAGVNSQLAERAIAEGFTLSKVKQSSRADLEKHFYEREAEELYGAGRRKPVPMAILQRLIEECEWKCCVCGDIQGESPVVIHHIEPHSKTQDDSYDNLVILCLNHHGLAHSEWKISRHPLPPDLVRKSKREWIEAVREYRAGLRPAPGADDVSTNVFMQSDLEALRHFRMIMDRPAMHQPFRTEGNMADFLTAITDIIRALNTGILKTREGDEIARTKPRQDLANPRWREKIDRVAARFEELRTRFEIAVRNQELFIDPDSGFYAFRNPSLPDEIDSLRDAIVNLFNQVLLEAGLESIRRVRPPFRF